ncbi:MAG TPA: N-acetylmuramoyl-L-alanine amidase [Bacteroidia bacterium]|nr:N-acetylmuramoyl-L-alanine amidase [Bacteroidia bacterium]
MKLFLHTILFLFFTLPSVSQEDVQSKIKYHTEKAQNYLDKEKALSGYYSIDKDGIKMYASPIIDKTNQKAEFEISWEQVKFLKMTLKDLSADASFKLYKEGKLVGIRDFIYIPQDASIKGKKIAIDPGHIANDFEMGDLEKKHIIIKCDSTNGIKDSIEIAEGMLTFATAQLLKEKLEKEGATVFLTRTADKCAFGKTYQQWKKEDLKKAVDSLYKIGEIKAWQKDYFISSKAKDRDIFRVIFRDLELAKRVELINNFNPDYTVVIHYNVDETNLDWEKCSSKNYNMCFVGGSFMKNDLSTKEKRFEFLRLLITDDLEKSIEISSSVMKSFESELKVPTATVRDAKYLIEGCLPTNTNGVYCRNLQLTRYIHSPIVYGETLYQDNINECKLLSAESDKTKNKRVQQVADAYFKGILNYLGK